MVPKVVIRFEGSPLMSGLSTLIEEAQERDPAPFTLEMKLQGSIYDKAELWASQPSQWLQPTSIICETLSL